MATLVRYVNNLNLFRYLAVNQILDEFLWLDGEEDNFDVIIEPHDVHNLTDDNSGDENNRDPSRPSENQLKTVVMHQTSKRLRQISAYDEVIDNYGMDYLPGKSLNK